MSEPVTSLTRSWLCKGFIHLGSAFNPAVYLYCLLTENKESFSLESAKQDSQYLKEALENPIGGFQRLRGIPPKLQNFGQNLDFSDIKFSFFGSNSNLFHSLSILLKIFVESILFHISPRCSIAMNHKMPRRGLNEQVGS